MLISWQGRWNFLFFCSHYITKLHPSSPTAISALMIKSINWRFGAQRCNSFIMESCYQSELANELFAQWSKTRGNGKSSLRPSHSLLPGLRVIAVSSLGVKRTVFGAFDDQHAHQIFSGWVTSLHHPHRIWQRSHKTAPIDNFIGLEVLIGHCIVRAIILYSTTCSLFDFQECTHLNPLQRLASLWSNC